MIIDDKFENICKGIKAELDKQRDKWGYQYHDQFKWLTILVEEVGEVSKAALEGNGNDYRDELIQVMAVAYNMYVNTDI